MKQANLIAAGVVIVIIIAMVQFMSGENKITNRKFPQHFYSSDELVQQGQELYQVHCVECHGSTGRGDGPRDADLPITATNFLESPFRYGSRPTDIATSIARGVSDGAMPGFAAKLDEVQIWSLAHLVWSWIPESTRQSDTQKSLENWSRVAGH